MAEVLITASSDKQVAARRLEEAIGRAGYGVTCRGMPESTAAASAAIGEAKAAIFIWSKSFLDSDLIHQTVAEARRQGKLIEVSADGIMPVRRADEPVALISGWRGEPFHPGWRMIAAELKRICGTRRSAAPEAAPAPGRGVAVPAAETVGRGRKLAIGTGALLVIAGAAAAWIGIDTVSAPPRQKAAEAAAPPAPLAVPPAAPPPPVEFAEAPPTPPAAAAPEQEPKPREPAGGKQAENEAQPRQPRPAAYRYAQNMRLFCERSGRSTRQCREFRRRAGLPPAPAVVARDEQLEATPPRRYGNARNMRLFCERAGRRTAECRAFRRSRQGGA